MNDHDLLDLIAEDAPQPGADQAETVLATARRTRHRRRFAAMATGAAGTAAVVIVATVALHGSGSGDGVHRTATGPSPSPTVQQHSASPPATAYAAAIRAITGSAPHVLYVIDHTCANVISQQPGGCHARPLPAAVRSDLRQALIGYAPVTYIADGASVTGGPEHGLLVRNSGAVLTLGPATVRGDRATVPVSVRRSGLDGRGSTYQLSRHGSGWTVTGTTGAGWIS
ncbi:MAG TPA: hypothetical protein VHC49_21015 [Mycobacteriales bacterium]|nr:hypothetical protein [Mycobacteriales bacterium]